MRHWRIGHQALLLAALLPIGSLIAMPVRVTPALVELSSTPPTGWSALTLSWWLPPTLSLPAVAAIILAIVARSNAARRRSLIISLVAGWSALMGILAGMVTLLVT